MLQANELRIGNWAQDEHFRFGVVKSVSDRSVTLKMEHSTLKRDSNHDFDGLDIEPIELTPDILLRAGFDKYEEQPDDGIGDILECYSLYVIDVFFDVSGALVLKDYHMNINRPKYLHQLQNLYFSLTGEELNIQL